MSAPLSGVVVVNASINIPADFAGARLSDLGATVTKIEPPSGDPVATVSDALYARLTRAQQVIRLDLREERPRAAMGELLTSADILITSNRPSALARIGLSWNSLAQRYHRLVQVAIVGHRAPNQELAGHDLTYVARQGLIDPPIMPRTLTADLAGAERAVTTALAMLLSRDRPDNAHRYAEVALEDSAESLALPWSYGITAPHGPLGGSLPYYRMYETADGWIALAALEPKFQERIRNELAIDGSSPAEFETVFRTRSAVQWEAWAAEHDIPLAVVR